MTITRNDLYDAAFRYKKTGLWKKLWDTEVFAIKLKSGEIGYVSIMGKNGEYNAMGLYIGDKGFGSYRILANMNGLTDSEFVNHEMLLQQRCLQMVLECKDGLMPEELAEVRAYAKKNEMKLTGKNAYPQFMKYEPNYHPWKVKTQEDMDALYEALTASCYLAEILKTTSPEVLGITSIEPETLEVPLFEVKNDKLIQAGFTKLPGELEEKVTYTKAESEIMLASVKKLPRKGIWESELIRMIEPVQDDPEETPYYPLLLFVVENKSGYLLPTPFMGHMDQNSQDMLQAFADAWKTQGCYPKEIRCRDERTFALLKDFCEKTDVKISIYKNEMPALDDAENGLLSQFSNHEEDDIYDQMTELMDAILDMSKEELKGMPKELAEQLRLLAGSGALPENMSKKLKNKLKDI